MDREIIFEKVRSKSCKIILKYNSRYTSSIVGPSTRVKSAEQGKIFKTTSILVPRTYDLFGQRWDRQALVSAITGCREYSACLFR